MNATLRTPPSQQETSRPDRAGGAESASHALIDLLLDTALRYEGGCVFQGATPAPEPGQPARWRVFGGDYYEGSAGIARALAYAGALLDRKDALETARAALHPAFRSTQGWSLHSGSLGVALVAAELAPLLDDARLERDALEIARRGVQQALEDAERGIAGFDLMSGMAGALYAAQEFAHRDPTFSVPADVLATQLCTAAQRTDQGSSWPLHPQDPTHLCGFGHGASGIAFALQRQRHQGTKETAAAARQFEALHFSPQACSWADLRVDSGGYPHYWCHGSVGIAIERREALTHTSLTGAARERTLLDYSAALQGIRREAHRSLQLPQGAGAGFELNASQCHGLSGLIDVLLDTGSDDDLALAQRLGECLRLDARRPDAWRCGLPSGDPTPGLMLGWAGILWGQLRLMDRTRVPKAWAPRLGPADVFIATEAAQASG